MNGINTGTGKYSKMHKQWVPL